MPGIPSGTITSANTVFTLSQEILPASPVQLQQFEADNIFDTQEMRIAETSMGVDGFMSAGFVYVPMDMNVALQANSPAIGQVFDVIYAQQQAAATIYPLSGTVIFPGLGKKYTLSNGILVGYKPLPDAKRLLQGQRFGIRWGGVIPGPA